MKAFYRILNVLFCMCLTIDVLHAQPGPPDPDTGNPVLGISMYGYMVLFVLACLLTFHYIKQYRNSKS